MPLPLHMRIAVLMSAAHLCHHLCTATLYPMLPLIRDGLGLNYFQSGLLVSSFTIFYGFAQLPVAILAERVNLSTMLIVGLAGTALATAGVGVVVEYWQMLVCFSVLGCMGATYHALAASLVSSKVPANLRGRSLGTHTIGGSFGFLVAPILSVALAHWTGSWRWAFIVMASPAFIYALLLWLDPFYIIRNPGAHQEHTGQAALGITSSAAVHGASQRLFYLAIIKKIGLLVGLSMAIQMVNSSLMSFLPLYLVDYHGVSSQNAGLMLSLLFGAGIIGAPVGGTMSDRVGRKAVILLSMSLSGPFLLGITLARAGPMLAAALLIYGTVSMARAPVIESLLVDETPSHRRTTVLGFYHMLSQETAGVLTPVVGYLIDHQGANATFTVMAVTLTLVGILAMIYKNRL